MSTGRLNSPLYDERGQFIGNQQPEANMLSGFNPMGAIGTGVSSGAIPAVANPLDSVPAGGGKGGGKGGGFAPPPPPNMYGGGGPSGPPAPPPPRACPSDEAALDT